MAHVGDVAIQTIRHRRKLVGIDVILVHWLLKNWVEVPEYVLLSEDLYRAGGTSLSGPVHEIAEELQGIGEVRAFFVDIEDLENAPSPPAPTWRGRFGRTAAVAGAGLPYMFGLRQRRSMTAPEL